MTDNFRKELDRYLEIESIEQSELELERERELERMKRLVIMELPDTLSDIIDGDYFWKQEVIGEAVKILQDKWGV